MVYVIIGISLDIAFFPQRLRLCCPVRFLVGLIHYSRDSQILFFSKNNFKTRSYGTIHIVKNYCAIIFSV